jgi:cytoskeletal protein RodZ
MDENFTDAETTTEPPIGIGAQLHAAREEKGLSLEQVAAETRIPQRHLVAIEAGDFGRLPGRTYAVGFSRTYAKTVGLDQDDVGAMVRAELDAQAGEEESYRPASFEPGDPARAPSRTLFYVSIVAGLLVIAGIAAFVGTLFTPAGELPSLVEQEQAEQAAAQRAATQTGTPAAQATAQPTGPVVFTAQEEAWVRFYTPQGTLMEALMAPGDSYTVPAGADRPMLRTGRPDALRVTIGGREVPRLSVEQRVVSDVSVTAEALIARGQEASGGAAAGENPQPGTT